MYSDYRNAHGPLSAASFVLSGLTIVFWRGRCRAFVRSGGSRGLGEVRIINRGIYFDLVYDDFLRVFASGVFRDKLKREL